MGAEIYANTRPWYLERFDQFSYFINFLYLNLKLLFHVENEKV